MIDKKKHVGSKMVDIGDASTLTEQKTTRLSLFIDSTLNFMRLFRKNRAAVVGFSVVLIFGMVAIFAKQVMPYDHLKQNLVDPQEIPVHGP